MGNELFLPKRTEFNARDSLSYLELHHVRDTPKSMLTLEKPELFFQKHQTRRVRLAHHEHVSNGARGDPSPPARVARKVLSYEQEGAVVRVKKRTLAICLF
jgi:hypothetical protein